MANPNSQVSDAVTATNVSVVGASPAQAMGSLYQTIGNSVAMAAANAITAQQQTTLMHQTSNTLGVNILLDS